MRALLAKCRIPAMLDLVEDFEDAEQPLVVFSAYKAPIQELAKRDGWAVITGDTTSRQRQEIVREFQAGNLKGVGLTIRAGGTGLTLTKASNVLFVDLDWVPTQNAQAVDRVRRIGQTAGSVQVIRLSSNHPVDRRVQEILVQKMELIHGAIEAEIDYKDHRHSVEIHSETQEEYDARMAQIEAVAQEAFKKEAKKRVKQSGWLEGERNKAQRPEAPITPDVAVSLRDALQYMLARCDGAQNRDDVGFNKPDAGRARVLAQTGLTTENELRVAERLLSRYHRQLCAKYPKLFA